MDLKLIKYRLNIYKSLLRDKELSPLMYPYISIEELKCKINKLSKHLKTCYNEKY